MNQEELRQEVVRRHHQGQSLRSMARDLKVGRGRVTRILRQHEQARSGQLPASGLPKARKKGPSKLDEFEGLIRELLERYPNITAVRLLEELKGRGYDGQYTIVRQRLKALRPQPTRPLVERFETAPGQQAQMDWAQYDLDFTQEGRRRVYLFGYLLGYSRRQYLCFTESQDFANTIRQHVRAFEHLGGVAATCLYDNMKVVVARHEAGEPIYNTRFLAFATHYGYKPIACQPRRPETKGKIERQFYYAEMNLLNGRTFRGLEHLNDVTCKWLAEVADARIHRQTGQRPVDLHVQEQPHLISLPANPYDVAEVVYRCVDCEGFVTYRQNQYSVPWRYVGQVLPIRITEKELIVYGPQVDEIARHPLLAGNCARQRQVCAAHRPQQDRRVQYELLRQSFTEFGEIGERFFASLVAAHRQGKAQARQILALRAHYHLHDLLAALERAVRFGAFSAQAVERILTVQAQPKTTLDTLADQQQQHLSQLLKDASTPPRDTKDYQKLLFQEQADGSEEDVEPTNPPDDTSKSPPSTDSGELPGAEGAADG